MDTAARPKRQHALGITDPRVAGARILVVDDQPANVKLLESFLAAADFAEVTSTTDSSQVLDLVASLDPDIVLLDLHMPDPDGFELLGMLSPWIHGTTRLPIVVLTADTTSDTKRRALGAGASDFLTKPFDPSEVLLRIRNLLETRFLQQELREQNAILERRVRERTRDLEEARFEVVERLALAAEFKDDATGQHAQRVGRTAALIARAYGADDETVELIRRAAPLHDIGKLGISDDILRKRGALDADELEIVKFHVNIGAEILAGARSPFLQVAQDIALTHHEWWDGSGYLAGLKGEGIPLAGRIVAVADVFDALTSRRPYRDPDPPDVAAAVIRQLAGAQFDPQIVAAFDTLEPGTLVAGAAEVEVAAA